MKSSGCDEEYLQWSTVLAGKIIEKTEEGTWGASVHEEGIPNIKRYNFKIGGLK